LLLVFAEAKMIKRKLYAVVYSPEFWQHIYVVDRNDVPIRFCDLTFSELDDVVDSFMYKLDEMAEGQRSLS